ncbi:putative rRNA maturation factor [Thiogranum longum]|uniref:Endoribonuclease YbeY n=1 Tax=Thiogranum longum TaxID=1537524 RepID=A0A4R1HAD9_9GAMM|nr:rRNA maturation RNase YbeY [Thiogranum longum]TCK17531.1 putative rRNA maturation factor [Thiogranum longum]
MTDSPVMLEIQRASDDTALPEAADLERWVRAALDDIGQPVELVIRIVDEEEGRELNDRYRGKNKPTNVLSFPFEAPPEVESHHLGDLVICASVVSREAGEQRKVLNDHWAHLVVHGLLHLRGYDHQTEEEAQLMESRERTILQELGIEDPYRQIDEVEQG